MQTGVEEAGRKRPTMADVAVLAGLSVPTVSRALRNHPDVSETTRQLTLDAAARIGYRPSGVARALRTGRHEAISFVLPYGLIGWWEPLLRGAGKAAAELGFGVTLNPVEVSSGTSMASLTGFFDRARDLSVDAFVVVTPDTDEWKRAAAALGKPVVLIDDTREHPGYHVWSSDSYGGAIDAVTHLVSRGRKRIAALIPHEGFTGLMVDDRLAGYREALRRANLEEASELIWQTAETYPPTLETSDAVDRAIAGGIEFDGVFAFTDYVALSALRSLRRAGISVPEDVSVIGFDDDVASVALDPPLTTMAQPLTEIGAGAVSTVVEMVNGQRIEPEVHKLGVRLVERKTS